MKTMSNYLVMSAKLNALEFYIRPVRNVILQTDLGRQFVSLDYEDLLNKNGIVHSYSRKGCPQDSSPI